MTQHKIRSLYVYNVDEEEYQEKMTNQMNDNGINISEVSIERNESNTYDYTFFLDMPEGIKEESIIKNIKYSCKIDFIR